jgi:hypothetical protein
MATSEPEVIALDADGAEVRLRWDPTSAWRLEAEPDWGRLEGVRLVSAVFDDGAALGVAAVRPREANGHADDAVAARFLDADGIETAPAEALVSVQYDSERVPRRLGIELWPDADSAPLRIAADREPSDEASDGRHIVPMTFRLNGVAGEGTYETVRRV